MQIKQIQDDLIEAIKNEVSDFSSLTSLRKDDLVSEYQNQYEGEGQWIEDFPTCFVQLIRCNFSDSNSGQKILASVDFIMFIGNVNTNPAHGLEIIERIITQLADINTTIDEGTFIFTPGEINFHGKDNSLKVYTMQVRASK